MKIIDLYDLTLKWEDDDKTTTIQNTSDPEIPDNQEFAEVSATETAQIVESTGSTTGTYILATFRLPENWVSGFGNAMKKWV